MPQASRQGGVVLRGCLGWMSFVISQCFVQCGMHPHYSAKASHTRWLKAGDLANNCQCSRTNSRLGDGDAIGHPPMSRLLWQAGVTARDVPRPFPIDHEGRSAHCSHCFHC